MQQPVGAGLALVSVVAMDMGRFGSAYVLASASKGSFTIMNTMPTLKMSKFAQKQQTMQHIHKQTQTLTQPPEIESDYTP